MRQDVEKEAGLVSTMCIKDYRSRKSEYRCHSKLHTIAADILGPVTMAKNLRAKQILVLTDLITRYVLSVPLRGTKAADAAKEIVENWVLGFGVADVLHTDQRKKFGNELMLEVCKLLKIDKSSSSTYHPKGKGQMERHDRVIADVNSKYNSRTWYGIYVTWFSSRNATVLRTTQANPLKHCLWTGVSLIPNLCSI